jgi:hypothetical protein
MDVGDGQGSAYSRHDRALGLWHRLAGDGIGIGARGANALRDAPITIALKRTSDRYTMADFATRIVNVDGSWRYRNGRFSAIEGAHSAYLVPESAHPVRRRTGPEGCDAARRHPGGR